MYTRLSICTLTSILVLILVLTSPREQSFALTSCLLTLRLLALLSHRSSCKPVEHGHEAAYGAWRKTSSGAKLLRRY